MSRDFFIRSVERALKLNVQVFTGPSPRIGLVPSSEGKGQFYTVNKTWCSCLGHEHTGRCWHRAFYIYTLDVKEGVPLERTGPEAAMVSGRTSRSA